MKVQITKGVNSFEYHGKSYLPGEVAEIDPAYFRSDFMEAIPEEAPPTEVAEPEPVVEEVKAEEVEEKSESAPVSKKRRS